MSYVLGQLLTVQPALFKRWVTLASSIHRTTVTFITNILFHASWPPEGNLKYEWFIPAHSWGWTKSGINLKGQQNLSLMAKLHWPKKTPCKCRSIGPCCCCTTLRKRKSPAHNAERPLVVEQTPPSGREAPVVCMHEKYLRHPTWKVLLRNSCSICVSPMIHIKLIWSLCRFCHVYITF